MQTESRYSSRDYKFVGILIIGVVEVRTVDMWVKPISSSSGLYYQREVEARLYSSEWRVVTFFDLKEAIENVNIVGNYVNLTIEYCNNYDRCFMDRLEQM
jgi:hypothetical protein